MSRKSIEHSQTVIEWSPKEVAILDPSSRSVRRLATTKEASGILGNQSVVVAVSRRAVFVRTMRVPNASASEIDVIVRMKLEDLFPLPAADLAYSIDLTDDLTNEGRLAIIVGMSASDLRRLHDEVRSAGFKIESVVPLSYGSVFLAKTLGLTACAVASRDEGGIGIDIVHAGGLRYSRVASAVGSASAEICRTYSVAGFPCGDVVAADGLLIEDAEVVSAISPLEALSGTWPSFVPTLELPETVALRSLNARRRTRSVAAVMFVAALALAAYSYFIFATASTAAAAGQTRADQELKSLKDQSKTAQTTANEASAAAAMVKRGFEPAQSFSDIISVASNCAPPNLWLTGITLERGKSILIRGTSRDNASVTTFVQNMVAATGPDASGDARPRFRDVTLLFVNNAKIDETPVVQFSISAFPVGNLPLVDKNVKKVTK